MKLPNCLKNLNSRKGNEKGSVTLFVLIAMLFFLMIGMMIFIINMNTETSQKRDVEKIKSEYSSGTSETDLEQMYQEAKAKQLATFLIKLIDSNGNIYNSGEWINKKWLDENRMPLKIVPEFPAGVTNIDVTIIDETVAGRPSVHVKDTDELKRMTIGAANDKQYTIVNNVDTTNQIKVNIDTTLPTVTKPAGGTIWKGTEEEEITGTDAGGAITITARDNLSGVKELKYIINNSPEAPSADAEWTTVEGATAQVTINNEKNLGVYYIHIIATDVAGNASEVVTSEPYYVKQANYKITTTTGTTYSETLKDAAEKPGAMVIKALNTFTDEVPATIAQNVTIDTNGKTLTMAETITVAAKTTATFVDNATTKGKLQRVVADGVRGDLITNSGIVNVGTNATDGATLESKDRVINGGTVTVYSGNIASKGKSENIDNAGIYSKTINVYGGNITNDTGNYGIVTSFSGTCNISGGTVSSKWGICPINGTLTISGSAKISGRTYGVCSSGSGHSYTLNMTGGNITATGGAGIYAGATNNITITGGTVTGTSGIRVTGPNCTLTIGNNSNALDRTTPVITGTTGTGINIAGATSTLNYYDGTIIGKTKGTKTFNGREVAFSVKDDTTVNFLTETEEGNVTRYYKPYTRQNTETNKWETVLEKQVNVTFNPGEGATVAENNRNVLTNVEYKEKAEDATIVSLPTPEKTGYTFKGWNGKNLCPGLVKGIGLVHETGAEINANDRATSDYIPVDFEQNNKYMLARLNGSLNSYVAAYNKDKQFIGRCSGNTRTYFVISNTVFTTAVASELEDKDIKYIRVTQYEAPGNSGTINDVDNIKLQMEVGQIATPYEPYYITDNTKVVQDQDHTLNAIWEANKYTVHFNGDGSTAGTVEDQKFKYDEEKALNENKFERKYTVTYDGNEGTPAKADDTATYTFANWGNKDILGYDLDFSEASKNTGTKYGKENGYTTISLDATEASSDKDMAKWTIQPQFNSGDRYKLTFYAKGNNLTTYFYGASNYLRVSKSESSQGVEHTANNNSTYSDGRIDFALTDEWTKYSVIYTLGSYGDRNVNKYVLFRVMHGNIASIYGVRFEKLENEEHQDKAVVKNLTSEPNGEVTLYAVWTPHEVTLPTATREGYIFNGWYDAATGGNKIGDAGDKYIPEANTTLHAQWRQVHYTILVGEENLVAETLEEAIKLAEDRITGSVTTATITSLMNYADSSTVTISKNITIDLKGSTLTMSNTITNKGTLEIKDTATGGAITRAGDVITNNASTSTVKISSGTITATNGIGVKNNSTGTINVTGGNITGTTGIYNGTNGTINVSGENTTVTGTDEIGIRGCTGTITVTDGTIQGKNYGIVVITDNVNSGSVEIRGGEVTSELYGVATNGPATVTVTGGTITGGTHGIFNTSNGIINVSGATTSITGTSSQGIRGYTGNVTISGGTIHGNTHGISVNADTLNSGSILMTGGTVESAYYGLLAAGNSTITMGTNDGTVSKETPEVISNATSGYYNGVYRNTTATFNFYDGKVTCYTEHSLNAAETSKPDGYQVVKRTDNGRETAVLEKEVIVTFDPNPNGTEGATVAETSRKVLTNVEYQYNATTGANQTLPTPTRTGYTFKEWQPADNLISTNPSDWQQGGIMDATGVESANNKRIRTDYIRVSPNTKYKLSVNNSNNIIRRYILYYNEEKAFIGRNEEYVSNVEEFTTPNNCYYIRTALQYRDGETEITPSNVTDANIYLTETVTDSTIVTQDQDHTLNAIWEATPYTVTLNAGDGTIDDGDDGWTRAGDNKTATKDITYDSNYGTLPTASRTGYTFEGWFTEATGGTKITNTTKMQTASEQSLYAHWTANNYTVTAHANGGAIASTTGWEGTGESATKQVTYDSAYGTLPEVTKTGYTFKGWNGKNLFELKENVDWKFGATTYNVNTSENSICIDTGSNFRFVQYYLPVLKANTTYTISGNVELINTSRGFIRISKERNKQNGNIFIFRNDTLSDGYFSSTFTIGENDETTASLCLYGNLGSNEETGAIFSNIQIEEGSTATPYEPYYITEDTKVTTASDHTLKAVWETIPYTISYELNKGTNNSSNPTGYTIETENITLQNPTRNGYTFIGWTGSNGDTPQTTVTIPKGSTGDRTYTANWEEKTYTLTIKPNGGAVDGSTTDVVRNLKYSDVSNINDPTRTGYTFGGYNELSGAAYNNGLASISVYNNNNNNNGVVTATTQAKSADNPITGMSNEVKITNAGTAQTQPGLGGFLHGKHADANKKYVHVFVAKLPEGYYFQNANNKLGDGATTQWLTSNEGTGNWQTYVYQVNAGSAGTFENFGYVYVSTDKDNDRRVGRAETGAYTAYLAYSNIYDITSDDSGIGQIDGTGVLTANWTATPYVVTLNAGDGTIDAGDDGWARAGDNKTATKDITYDSDYGTLPTASRTGYTFDGWFTEATGGTKITDTTKMQTASAQTLYPHWTANPYTIHFNANGGTGEMTDLPMTYGTPANLTANAFSRTGYKFVKWTSNADGTGNEYIDGQTVNNLTEINNDTVNLFAQWEERPFVVTFNPNGGIVTPESKEITYNSTYGDLPSGDNIKRLGYTFAGWYKEAELTNEVTSETTYDITEDSTLYAKWTPHVYTVTFNKNGGTGTMSDQSFTYGQTQNLRANTFTRTGYTFAGWARAENGTIEFTNEQSISNLTPENGGTITLYAVWNDVTRPSWSVRLLDIINK